MRIRKTMGFGLAVIGVVCIASAGWAAAKAPTAEAIMKAASKQNRYVIATFYKKNQAASKKMLADVKRIQPKYSGRASFVTVDVGSAANDGIISRYGVDRSPVPL